MIISDLVSWIEENVELFADLKVDVLAGDVESICIRADPAEATVQRYMDGSKIGNFVFSIYARSNDIQKVIAQHETLAAALDLPALALTEKVHIKIEPIVGVNLVAQSETNYYTYVSQYKLEYETGG